jgi:hypothetical protein
VTEIDPKLLELAGFALVHAAATIERGERLGTFAVVESGGERELIRYEGASVTERIQGAHSDVAERVRGEGRAVVAVDGFIVGKSGDRQDALILELINARAETLAVVFQRYIAAAEGQPFALTGRPVSPQQLLPAQLERIVVAARTQPDGARLFPQNGPR